MNNCGCACGADYKWIKGKGYCVNFAVAFFVN